MSRPAFPSIRHGAVKSGAFTLLEILVATVVLVVLIALLAQVVGSASSIWQRSEQRIDAFREARAALDLMRRDLARVVPAHGLPAVVIDRLFEENDGIGSQHNQQIYVLSSTRNAGRSDVCAVGYYCRWNPDTNGYELMRYFANSDETFDQLREIAVSGSPSYTPENVYAPGAVPETSERLAAMVWNLSFQAFDKKGDPITEAPFVVTDGLLPASIEVELDAVSPKAVRPLIGQTIARDFWFYPTSHIYKRHIAPSMQHFKTRIPLDLDG